MSDGAASPTSERSLKFGSPYEKPAVERRHALSGFVPRDRSTLRFWISEVEDHSMHRKASGLTAPVLARVEIGCDSVEGQVEVKVRVVTSEALITEPVGNEPAEAGTLSPDRKPARLEPLLEASNDHVSSWSHRNVLRYFSPRL